MPRTLLSTVLEERPDCKRILDVMGEEADGEILIYPYLQYPSGRTAPAWVTYAEILQANREIRTVLEESLSEIRTRSARS